jgi:Flp pilus assembly protein TadB
MGRRSGQGPQRPVKGFRPGKEPPQLKKQRAKQQFGQVSGSQERLIEFFANRSPEEARRLMGRWRIGLLAGALVLAVLGLVLYGWSVVAAVIVHVLAGVALFLWWQLRRQRPQLEAMADAVSGGASQGGGRKKR